jgi:hypothetical protein
MPCRTTKLKHPSSGNTVETPLLVPSFSSKGFGRSARTGKSAKHDLLSGLHRQFNSVSEYMTDSLLFSAFDVHHKFLPHPRQIEQFPEIMILDSGGYEISTDTDLSDVEEPEHSTLPWNVDLLKAVWADWPQEVATILVSYDSPKERLPFADQVSRARELFRGQQSHLTAFLLKPESEDQRTLQQALGHAFATPGELRYFSVIGVTEREVGSSMLERMVNLALLREALDRAGLQRTPIHVFGALDPVSTVLYFFAGAEIFDGLTWLRYAYAGGRCVYTHNHGTVALGLEKDDDSVRALTQVRNITHLQTMQHALREFCSTQDFKRLAERIEFHKGEVFLRNSMNSMNARLQRRAV